jgi:hypothetical protein
MARRSVPPSRSASVIAFVGVEGVHLAGHSVRHLPLRDRARIEQRTIDRRTRRIDVVANSG